MSMKSFDKFCERLILAEPGSEKEVFDERQRVMQQRLAVEALLIYVGVTLINTMMMEIFYQWAESWMAATFLFVALCLLWWQIRCAVKGCMAPVSGKYIQRVTAAMVIIMGASNALRYLVGIGEENYFVVYGRLSGDFMFMVSGLLLAGCGIFMLCVNRHEEKKESEDAL